MIKATCGCEIFVDFERLETGDAIMVAMSSRRILEILNILGSVTWACYQQFVQWDHQNYILVTNDPLPYLVLIRFSLFNPSNENTCSLR